MITIVIVLLVLSAVGYVLASRWRGRPVNPRRMLLVPALLFGYGLLQLTGTAGRSLRPADVALIVAGTAVAAALGVARGRTVEISSRNGQSWLRYRPATLAYWGVTVATRLVLTASSSALGASAAVSRGPAILISVGVTLLAEALVVTRRGFSRGGLQWHSRSRRHQVATH